MGALIIETLKSIATPIGIAYIFGGAFIGLVLGAIPGLSGGTITVLLLPMTYKMSPALAMGLFVAIYVGSTSGGCIGSILLGIPGTNASMVTAWDGYEFTKKGQTVRALSNAVVANFIGTIPSLVIAMFFCPILSEWAIQLGPWEYFGMCLCAIALVVGLTKGNLLKNLLSVGLAMLLACIGLCPMTALPRLNFGNFNLYGGFKTVDVMMGLMGARIMLLEYARQSKLDTADIVKVERFLFPGEDLLKNLGCVIRSFFIGAIIGFLPGLGGSTSSVLAYSLEKSLSKDKSNWGKGEIKGVLAPEVANNAGIGGAMIPMISLGIPGDGVMVLFMTALSVHGITPGPLLVKDRPDVVYMLYVGAMLAAIFVLIVETVGMPMFPALLKIPYRYLYPVIIVMCILGTYFSQNNMFGLIVCLVFCAIGVGMTYLEMPILPFILTFILSPLIEKNFRLGMNYSKTGIAAFFTRPLSCAFIVIGVLFLVYHVINSAKEDAKRSKVE